MDEVQKLDKLRSTSDDVGEKTQKNFFSTFFSWIQSVYNKRKKKTLCVCVCEGVC